MDIAAAFDRENGNVVIIFGIAVLFNLTCDEKTFGIFVRFNIASGKFPRLQMKFRNETSAAKIQFFCMQQQKRSRQQCRTKEYRTFFKFNIETPDKLYKSETPQRKTEFYQPCRIYRTIKQK